MVRGEPTAGRESRHRGASRPEAARSRPIARRRTKKRRCLVAAAFLLALALAAAVLYGPFSRYLSSRRELARTQSLLTEEEEATRALMERRERALSNDYVEEEARKMGYVKPGEIPLIVLDRLDPETGREEDPAEVSLP